MVKDPLAMWETWVQPLGLEDPLEEGMTTHSSILAWRIPWTERPGGLQFIGLQTVGHDRATKHSTSQSIAYSFCHTAETNKTLGSNYPPIKKKKKNSKGYQVVYKTDREVKSQLVMELGWEPGQLGTPRQKEILILKAPLSE